MRVRARKSPWTTAGAASSPAAITARRSRTVRPAPPPASGTAHASSRSTSWSNAFTRRGRARNTLASIRMLKTRGSLEDLAGLEQDRGGDRQAERPRGLEIDGEIELRRLLDRQIARPCALQDPI